MSTKFFNNTTGNTLFDKLKGIAAHMTTFDRFLAVVGFFRSSGYFKLRSELGDVSEIKILIGINIDDIFRKHNPALLMLADPEKAKLVYQQDFLNDIRQAHYSADIEKGILQMCEDLTSGRLELRIHATQDLHAKFYLCLPQAHSEHSDGWVIMGSSNISDSGLGIKQPPQYELNVAMKDYDDVKYCHDEFQALWEQAIPLSLQDVEENKRQTYLGHQPTPYELYIKVLIDTFGDQVEDDFTIQLPDGVKELKYQKDAVIQGYQMLMQHNGLILADVVGLGKTMIAAMIAKRFIEANGRFTNVLVVFPPALEENWRSTFQLFGISNKAQFINNGSLSKILEGRDQYKEKEEFNLVIVDEAHGFRNDGSQRYDDLQKICKSPCNNRGLLNSWHKKVMLLSATPLNNRPDDLLNLLLLFQDSQSCTIEGIHNLKGFFAPLIQEYKSLMQQRGGRNVTEEVDQIYEQIRSRVIDKVTIRRTRSNILNDPDYRADIKSQGITFPRILPPQELEYEMDADTRRLFYSTLQELTEGRSKERPNGQGLNYARYRAIEFLKPGKRERYRNAVHIGQSLAGIYRVHMVKRLESSFYAFKMSLKTLLRITDDMINMFEQDKVIIAPELKVKNLQSKGMELDAILEHAVTKGFTKEEILYRADDFEKEFLEMLKHDRKILKRLNREWEQVKKDPKLDKFSQHLPEFLSPSINRTGKLVLFSESVDTLQYLYEWFTGVMQRADVLIVIAKNRNQQGTDIQENFDANYPICSHQYNILLTSDVLAEGVNLHRSNVIVNYDSPWNATRLMQRIGRVNRIGSVADCIYNYMFYPSQQGDEEIQLYNNALIKLQGFHSAFGEDAQIYSREEIVHQFRLFDSNVRDQVDRKIALLREVQELYATDRKLYHKIKNLPPKSRVVRQTSQHRGESLVFVSSNVKTEYYRVSERKVEAIDFLDAADILKALPTEPAVPMAAESPHYQHVNRALQQYNREYVQATDTATAQRTDLDKTSREALNFLRQLRQLVADDALQSDCQILTHFINEGTYSQLPRALKDLSREYKNDRNRIRQDAYRLQAKIHELIQAYQTESPEQRHEARDISDPQIIISETFQ